MGRKLAELAAQVHEDHVVVELGSFKGKSTCYLAKGARTQVFAIDLWTDSRNVSGKHHFTDPAVKEAFYAQTAQFDNITPIQAHSTEPAHHWTLPVGLLFIDASHVYEDVKADFGAWKRHVVPGGVVVFDDYDTPANPGVKRFVDELRADEHWIDWTFDPAPLAYAWRAQ